uniref:Uncharacterized protein n=1 Tax=Cucumis melo TaxID=3656 RepID=A0A9I9EIW6_CUCME
MNPIKILWSLAFNAASESKPHIQIPITPPPSPSSDFKHKKSVSIRRYSSSVQMRRLGVPMELRSSHRECECRLIRHIDVNVKNLYWADSGDLVAIADLESLKGNFPPSFVNATIKDVLNFYWKVASA